MKLPPNFRWHSTGRTLGSGGQGDVLEVTDSTGEFSGNYALKPLRPGKPRQAYERFNREVEALSKLEHPSIVRIVDRSETDSGFHYFVMETVEGRTLKRIVKGEKKHNPFYSDVETTIELFRNLVSAMEAWSSSGLIHRDLSPANVIIKDDGVPVVIDFGICQDQNGERITLTDEGIGTPNYMSPECESGSDSSATIAADIYSVGKLIWSAVTGQLAFARESPVFCEKSMATLFPKSPMTFHLHHIFENSIRHKAADRWATPSGILAYLWNIERLVRCRFLPLELLDDLCPHCGIGELRDFQQSHMVFGNPMPSGISPGQCPRCGFCFARSRKIKQDEMTRRRSLT